MTAPGAPNDLEAGVANSVAAPLATPLFVLLNGVVARDAAGQKGASRGSLQAVTAQLGPGVHAFLGAPEDGTIALCDVIAGVRPPLRGTVLVHGESPWASAPIRSCIGSLLAAPELPEARTVRASVLQSTLALGRAPAEADAVLPSLGIGALADRSPRSLSFAETRAVELALALHVARVVAMRAAPPVLILYEPCADLALPSMRSVDDAIAARRAAGACVILATSSPADARRLADTVWILHGGSLVRRESGDGRGLAFGDAEIAVWFTADAGPAQVSSASADAGSSSGAIRSLAAAVSAHPAVRAAYWDDPPAGSGRPPVLRVRGPDRDACALAVLDAAASARVAVEAITSSTPDLGAVRNASLAWLQRLRGGPRPPVAVRAPAAVYRSAPVSPQVPVAGPAGAQASLSEAASPSPEAQASPLEAAAQSPEAQASPLEAAAQSPEAQASPSEADGESPGAPPTPPAEGSGST